MGRRWLIAISFFTQRRQVVGDRIGVDTGERRTGDAIRCLAGELAFAFQSVSDPAHPLNPIVTIDANPKTGFMINFPSVWVPRPHRSLRDGQPSGD